ncbi:hypothetical protein EYF80_044453 [Liparis tanakae]|uniref:Uncharacterized protein n=1 Tax=Liparis tanakae TaxID=230148 RepID=A0A4Z2FVV9_9TELE|nr:hypothetical protein EYF80_044453 [Liparis tanakae]
MSNHLHVAVLVSVDENVTLDVSKRRNPGPDVDSVEDTGPQASQHVGGAVRADWDLPTCALRGAVA